MSVRIRLALLLPLFALAGGCLSSHSGSVKITVGNATFLPELSTKSGSIHLRLLESINGAVIYAPSNSYTSIAYTNYSHSSYFGILEYEDSKSLSTTISIPTDRKKTNDDDINNTPQQKKHNANEEKVTADAPITKRCDGYQFLLKCNQNQGYSTITSFIIPHSDPQVFKRHTSSFKTKTQNITADNTSRDCRNQYPTTPERSNQTDGFRAFPIHLLCRDRSIRGNLLMSPT